MADIFNSRIVTFSVGTQKQKQVFQIHEAALAKLSRPLSVLLAGEMKEATEGHVVLDDCNPATFGLLLQFAYTSTYTFGVSKTNILEESQREVHPDTRRMPISAIVQQFLDAKKRLQGRNTISIEQQLCLQFFYSHPEAIRESEWASNCDLSFRCQCLDKMPYGSRHANCSFCKNLQNTKSYIFLSRRFVGSPGDKDSPLSLQRHADLYVLADRFDIQTLKALCVTRVHEHLIDLRPSDKTLTEVTAVTRLLFNHTTPRDSLRRLLIEFLVVASGKLETMENKGFLQFLSDVPAAAIELLRFSMRMNTRDSQLISSQSKPSDDSESDSSSDSSSDSESQGDFGWEDASDDNRFSQAWQHYMS
ncbi:hypothetical protein ACHAQH_009046 [Verticillium albo-atrum]